MTESGNKCSRGRPPGLRRVTCLRHGGYCQNPLEALAYWRKHAPEVAEHVDEIVKTFLTALGWDSSHQRIVEIQELAILITSRDMMTGTVIDADFSRAIHDRDSKKIYRIREHHLFDRLGEVDEEVQRRLERLGLKSKNKNTEGDNTNDSERRN